MRLNSNTAYWLSVKMRHFIMAARTGGFVLFVNFKISLVNILFPNIVTNTKML